MSDLLESLFTCDKCEAPLSIMIIKGQSQLVAVGKCAAGHKKKFTLLLTNLNEWAPIMKPHFFRCVLCDAEISSTPIFRGPWAKVSITCPTHGKNETRLLPSSVYNAMINPPTFPSSSLSPLPTTSETPPTSSSTPLSPLPTTSETPPACQYCGGLTNWISQYSRYYCYNCQKYVEDQKVIGKVRTPIDAEDLKTKLKSFVTSLEKNIPYSLWDFPQHIGMPELDAIKIENALQELLMAGEIGGKIDHATGDITILDGYPAATHPSPPTDRNICPTCGAPTEFIDTKDAYFCRNCFEYVEIPLKAVQPSTAEEIIEVVRDFDYVGGQVRFKVAIRNKSSFVITNIGIELDIPNEFKLVRILPETSLDDLNRGLAKIEKLMPNSSQGTDFYLEPVACGMGVIAGIVKYLDAQGNYNSTPLKKREVAIKCPLIFSPEEANIAMIRNLMNNLSKDFRRWALPTSPPDSFSLLHDLICQFEINHIQAFQISGDPYQSESWYYTRAKTSNHQIALCLTVSELTNTLDLTIACEDMAELTGLLAKISEDFKDKVKAKLHTELRPVFGNLKELLCNCGSPISRLPSETEETTCNACHKAYSWEMLGY